MIYLMLLLAVLPAPSPDVTALLPADGTPHGWSRSGEASLYEGGALFEYVNGGADAYHDRGFERLLAQAYAMGDAEVQLEIYDMGSPTGARAIFDKITTGLETATSSGMTVPSRKPYRI